MELVTLLPEIFNKVDVFESDLPFLGYMMKMELQKQCKALVFLCNI